MLAHDHGKHLSSKRQISRKETRKQNRASVKKRKAEFFSTHTKDTQPVFGEEHVDSPKRKKRKLTANAAVNVVPSTVKPAPAYTANSQKVSPSKPVKKNRTALERLAADSSTLPSHLRTAKETEEDSYISYLESKLGYMKGGKGGRNEDDGLDGALKHSTACISWTYR